MKLVSAVSLGLAAALSLASARAGAQQAEVEASDASGKKFGGDAAAGERVFRQCAACHTVEAGKNRVGPTLHGIVGRMAGTVEGFAYSKSNKEFGKEWSVQLMFDYLENPRTAMPGNKMAFAGLRNPQDRADVIAFIVQKSK